MVKEFTIGFSRTINLGNFESARVEASVTVEVTAEMLAKGHQAVMDASQAELRQLLELTYRAQMKGHSDERTAQRIKTGGGY